jgi:hypothetical protein
MIKIWNVIGNASLLLLTTCLLGETTAREPEVRLESITCTSEIKMTVRVTNHSDDDIFIPHCGNSDGQMYLCFVGLQIQVHTSNEWKRPDLYSDNAVPGGPWPSAAVRVAAGQSKTFAYRLCGNIYKIAPGTKCRLRLALWPKEHMDDAPKEDRFIYTPEFTFP